jgi:predicted transcriptional regulator
MARISKYEQWKIDNELNDKLFLIECWARNGLSNVDIANNLGITTETFYQYIKKYTDFSDALRKGKEITDFIVENALYKRAIGFEYNEIKTKYINGHLAEKTVIKKFIPPDVTAQAFWLKNRKPSDWREKQEVQQSIEFVDDGFINALKEKANEINEEGVDFVEE